jgi:hypothetical protein
LGGSRSTINGEGGKDRLSVVLLDAEMDMYS